MISLARYVILSLKFTALVGVALICGSVLYAAFSFVALPSVRTAALRAVGLSSVLEVFDYGPESGWTQAHRDLWSVTPTHKSVSAWVQYCIGVGSGTEIPYAVEKEFILPREMQLEAWYNGNDTDKPWPNTIRKMNKNEIALIRLSSELSESRISLMSKLRSSYIFLEVSTIIMIILGAITTILVSVSSTEFGRGDGCSQRLIRILAIVFPALSTAAATLFGFYNPQVEWGQVSRALSSETQLHSQIALGPVRI